MSSRDQPIPLEGAGTIAFYRERQSIEAPLTLNILKTIPASKLDYTPHPNSQTARAISSTLLRCLRACVELADSNDIELRFHDPTDHQEIVDTYQQLSDQLHDSLTTKVQSFWEGSVIVRANGKAVLEHSRGEIFWLFLFDAIHHRGQLSTYLRPMGSKVPSIYGQSADGNF